MFEFSLKLTNLPTFKMAAGKQMKKINHETPGRQLLRRPCLYNTIFRYIFVKINILRFIYMKNYAQKGIRKC